MASTEPLKARFMRENFFTFQPTHTCWISTNHAPIIRDHHEGIWRRVFPINFERRLDDGGHLGDPEATLKDQLRRKPQLQAVLTWAVEGSAMYAEEGLNPPETVLTWLDDYRETEAHPVREFVEECLTVLDHDARPPVAITNTALRDRYVAWADDDKERTLFASHKVLGRELRSLGYEQARTQHNTVKYWPRLSSGGAS